MMSGRYVRHEFTHRFAETSKAIFYIALLLYVPANCPTSLIESHSSALLIEIIFRVTDFP